MNELTKNFDNKHLSTRQMRQRESAAQCKLERVVYMCINRVM